MFFFLMSTLASQPTGKSQLTADLRGLSARDAALVALTVAGCVAAMACGVWALSVLLL